jgi:ribosome-binding protein aMBF1 (putative translation factor)
MPKPGKTVLLPKQEMLLRVLGEQIKLARLRRNLSVKQLAERAGIAGTTLF